MTPPKITLPAGYRLQFHETIDSTNSQALRVAESGEPGNVWIVAVEQAAGRGRAGRRWESREGNLFASLFISVDCELQKLPELGFVAGIALHDTVRNLNTNDDNHRVELKWPNDLLFNGKKVAGLLLESLPGAGKRPSAVIGFGVNLLNHPSDTALPATNLSAEGIHTTREMALETLASRFANRHQQWANGENFASIRAAWLNCSMPVGSSISVKTANEALSGNFDGIDDDGALLLSLEDKSKRRITAGDIFPL